MSSNHNQFDDAQLDKILKKYGEGVPRPGLEGRILARLVQEREPSTTYGWNWPFTIATLTAALAVFVVLKTSSREGTGSGQIPIANIAHQGLPAAISHPKQNATAKPHIRQQVHEKRRLPEPRLEQFPAPAPLNEQEVMLMQYMQEHQCEAVVVAKAREEMRKQDLARFEALLPLDQRSQNSE